MKPSLPEAFTAARKTWGGNGSGSTAAKTATLVAQLPALFRQLAAPIPGARFRVLDLGCGDVAWIIPALVAGGVTAYHGVDVAPAPIEANRLRCRDAPLPMTFEAIRGPDDVLPEADLVICRDCLAHLPGAIAAATVRQAFRSAPWLLATTYRVRLNRDLKAPGLYRPLDLTQPPIGLAEPVMQLEDSDRKVLGLFARPA